MRASKVFSEKAFLIFVVCTIVIALALHLLLPRVLSLSYSNGDYVVAVTEGTGQIDETQESSFVPLRIPTPPSVKGVYMTSWAAGTPSLRQHVVDLIEETELNAVVIDIKDDTGRISFDVYDPELERIGAEEVRVSDMREFIRSLNEKDVYVIGRISVFQDPYLVSQRPDLAVARASNGSVWKDRKGLTWLDPGSEEVWSYAVSIAEESWKAGFDEINFDYIRYPTDGNLDDIYYPHSGVRVDDVVVARTKKVEQILEDGTMTFVDVPTAYISGRARVIQDFFKYLDTELHTRVPDEDPIISADLFGLVTIAQDDIGIGQWLEYALPYFDYVAPMVYPSHFSTGVFGYANPAANPYEVVFESMSSAVVQTQAIGESVDKLRPWLQDFDLGATYTADLVRQQIQATYDAGLDSWTLWDPSNIYTPGGLLPVTQGITEEIG